MWEAGAGVSSLRQRVDVTVLLEAEHAVARVLASAAGEREAYPRLLEAIGSSLGWDVGGVWEEWEADRLTLRCVEAWRGDAVGLEAFGLESLASELPVGRGPAGRAWEPGQSA